MSAGFRFLAFQLNGKLAVSVGIGPIWLSKPLCCLWRLGGVKTLAAPFLSLRRLISSEPAIALTNFQGENMRKAICLLACVVGVFVGGTVYGATQLPSDPSKGTWITTMLPRDINHDGKVDAYYDTSLNVTWLDAAPSSISMTWADSNAWAKQDRFGISGWRLPTLVDTGEPGCPRSAYSGTDCGYNVLTASSELAHLFFITLGNRSSYTPKGTFQTPHGMGNFGAFKSLAGPAEAYWSGLEYGPDSSMAWFFAVNNGSQFATFKHIGNHTAIAVIDGDVAAVPEAGTGVLMLAGLSAIGFVRRLNRRR